MTGDDVEQNNSSYPQHPHKKRKRKRSTTTEELQGSQLQKRKSELALTRTQLPVYQFKQEICRLLSEENNDVLLVVAETGSGKSTQIPAYLDECGLFSSSSSREDKHARSICVTQPRRVAAMTVAKRVAEEQGCRIGTAVGYRVRFDDCTCDKTRIVYATDGMLLREAMSDPLLTRYSVVVLDESHERSLQTDILFGVVARAMAARGGKRRTIVDDDSKDSDRTGIGGEEESVDQRIQHRMKERAKEWKLPRLKVVVMSATLDVDTFMTFFPGASSVKIPGRMYPVQIVYTKEPQDVSIW